MDPRLQTASPPATKKLAPVSDRTVAVIGEMVLVEKSGLENICRAYLGPAIRDKKLINSNYFGAFLKALKDEKNREFAFGKAVAYVEMVISEGLRSGTITDEPLACAHACAVLAAGLRGNKKLRYPTFKSHHDHERGGNLRRLGSVLGRSEFSMGSKIRICQTLRNNGVLPGLIISEKDIAAEINRTAANPDDHQLSVTFLGGIFGDLFRAGPGFSHSIAEICRNLTPDVATLELFSELLCSAEIKPGMVVGITAENRHYYFSDVGLTHATMELMEGWIEDVRNFIADCDPSLVQSRLELAAAILPKLVIEPGARAGVALEICTAALSNKEFVTEKYAQGVECVIVKFISESGVQLNERVLKQLTGSVNANRGKSIAKISGGFLGQAGMVALNVALIAGSLETVAAPLAIAEGITVIASGITCAWRGYTSFWRYTPVGIEPMLVDIFKYTIGTIMFPTIYSIRRINEEKNRKEFATRLRAAIISKAAETVSESGAGITHE